MSHNYRGMCEMQEARATKMVARALSGVLESVMR